jgi:hypothetical protein
MLEALQGERQVCAAFRAGDGVDLVYDHGAERAEHAATTQTREQDVQRLRRRDENVRGRAHHPRARGRRRIARSHRDADLGKLLAARNEALAKLRERTLEVPLDVVVERLEGRDVEEVDRVRERAIETVRDESVELPEKRRERFSGAGRREDERVLAAGDRRPPALLRCTRST